MINKYLFVLFTVFTLVLTSCVSKKKYLEMESGRQRAEQRVRELTEANNNKAARIEAMIQDYEEMKNSLLENNSIKDSYIDSLNAVMFALEEQLTEQKESLQKTSFTLDFEKQRLTEALANKNRTIQQLENEIEELENDITSRSSLIDQKNYDINLLDDKVEQLQSQLETKDERIEELEFELEQIKKETQTQLTNMKTELQEKEQTITRLQNNVNLLKKELGEGN
ncbi:MAG: hypothetical protein ACOCVA_06330 [Prolixibacteraceae bacterium]